MNRNGRISVPVTISDIKTVLGVADNRLTYLCRNTHNKINPWSRYKPVPFRYVSKFKDTIISINGYSSWADTPITEGPDGVMGKPWYKGGFSRDLYQVPEIDAYHDMFLNGGPNPASIWKYQAPPSDVEGYYCRIGDFVGYNHQARCPLSAYTNYSPFKDAFGTVTEGMVHIDGKIYAGFNNVTSWDDDAAAKEAGELTIKDVVTIIDDSEIPGLYLCIVIHNKTQNLTRQYSKPVNILNEAGRNFELSVDSQSAIKYGGMAHQVRIGDVLEIGVYLAREPDNESISTNLNSGWSLYTGASDSPHVCRTVTVGSKSVAEDTYYRILYRLNQFTYNAEGYLDEIDESFGGSYPVWINLKEFRHDDNDIVRSVERGLSNIKTSITVTGLQYFNKTTSTWEDTTRGSEFKFTISLTARLAGGENSSGEYLWSQPLAASVTKTGEDIKAQFGVNGDVSPTFNYYSTSNAASTQSGASIMRGIPLPQHRDYTDVYIELIPQAHLQESALFPNTHVLMYKTNSTASDFTAANGS